WADAETNPDDKQKLYTSALNHLDPVLKANPKDVELLKMGGEILLALGKSEEAEKLFGMAMKIRVDEFKALQAEHKKNPLHNHPSKPEGRLELQSRVQALEALLKQVEDIPANSPELKLQRLQCERDYHQAVYDFQADTYPPPYNIWQPSKEYDAYCEKLR